MRLMLDPGHGGRNHGTRDAGFVEKNYTLNFATYLKTVIEHTGWPIRPLLTRVDDSDLSLDERVRIAADTNADLAISIHVNSSIRMGARGLMVFHLGGALERELARAIARAAPQPLLRRAHASVYASPESGYPRVRNVLKGYESRNIPALLIELGFRSNENDRAFLLSPHGPQCLVASVLAGLSHGLYLKGAGTWT